MPMQETIDVPFPPTKQNHSFSTCCFSISLISLSRACLVGFEGQVSFVLVQVIIAVNLRLLRRPLQNRREFIGAEGVKLVSMYFFGGAGRISDRESCLKTKIKSYLDEANVGSLLAEALTADVEAVLADQTSGVGADAAVEYCVSHCASA